MVPFCVKNSYCRHSGESRNLDFLSRLDAGLRLSGMTVTAKRQLRYSLFARYDLKLLKRHLK